MMMQRRGQHSAGHRAAAAFAAGWAMALGACGSGGGSSGLGAPGTGGGPHGPGLPGNPLAVPLEFSVRNEQGTERIETVRVSVPFPKGGYANVDNVVVSGQQTAWTVLQRWADGTVRIAQAQFTDWLLANEYKAYGVARDVAPLSGPFQRNDWVLQLGGAMQFGAQVLDTFQVPYRAFADGPGEVLSETPLVQVRRHRLFHQAVAGQVGIGRDYLISTFYVTEFRDAPMVLVDWVLGNDYLGADSIPNGNTDPNLRPLGMIDVREARFLVRGVTEAIPYRPVQEAIGLAEVQGDGYVGFPVLQDSYLEDGQTRRYRFLLRFEHPAADPATKVHWQNTATAMVQRPLFPLARIATWQQTMGAGLLGGPVTGPVDALNRAESDYGSWAATNQFGAFGAHGDVLDTSTTGTPRNHPLSPELAHAIQAEHHRLLQKLEQMAWMQAVRPYHLYGLQVSATQDIMLWDGVPIYPGSRDLSHESLGRRALWANDPYAAYRTLTQTGNSRAHGWGHFDEEHWTTDLLFDYWTISGDAWAREELRQLGQSLKGLMRLQNAFTASIQAIRAEGWVMQSFVQCYLATGDVALKDYAIQRMHQVVDAQRRQQHPSKALAFQANYAGTLFPLNHLFFMPWQHGPLLFGYLGALEFLQDPQFLHICEDVPTTIDYSWVSNYQDPQFGLVANGLRYYTPVEWNGAPIPANFWDSTPGIGVRWGDAPLGGAHTFLTAGLYMLADRTPLPTVWQRALAQAVTLRGLPLSNNDRWDKWHYCIPEWYTQ